MNPNQKVALPPLAGNEDLNFILGSICFKVAHIGRKLHELGLYEVNTHAEEEQAAAIHWMLSLYLEHGAKWKEIANAILKGNTPTKEKDTNQ